MNGSVIRTAYSLGRPRRSPGSSLADTSRLISNKEPQFAVSCPLFALGTVFALTTPLCLLSSTWPQISHGNVSPCSSQCQITPLTQLSGR